MASSGKQSSLLSFFKQKQPVAKNEKSIQQTKDLPKDDIKKENHEASIASVGTKTEMKEKSRPIKRPKPVESEHSEGDENKEEKTNSPPARRVTRLTNQTKRKRVILSSDEEESDDPDFDMNDDGPVESIGSASSESSDHSESDEDISSDGENETPPKKDNISKTKNRVQGTVATSISTELASSFISSFKTREDRKPDETSLDALDDSIYQRDHKGKLKKSGCDILLSELQTYAHESFDFLKPEKIRDLNKRRPSDADYDPSTLFVPESFLNSQTPGHKQWWTLKSRNFDTILLFKVGKFYELYHMDAVISFNHLSLTYMRGNYAHTGFPESAYGRFSDQLVSRGFKVARVEQTETPAQLEERSKGQKIKDKVVRRELCRVTTCGTRTYGVLDGNDEGMAESRDASAKHLLAIKETKLGDGLFTYGMCIVDTSVGKFMFGQFTDDEYRSQLRTLIANYQPAQVLLERGCISSYARNIVNCMLSSIPREMLASKTQFLNGEKTVKELSKEMYIGSSSSSWPLSLRSMLDNESVIPKADSNYEETWSAIGAIITYLRRCLIDVDIITMKAFEKYDPTAKKSDDVYGVERWRGRRLVLDGITLENLCLVPVEASAAHTRGREASFSLYNTINKCATSFGKRLLREWICAPTCDADTLNARQYAIEWLIGEGNSFTDKAYAIMRQLPDLDRLIQKIHTLGLKYRSEKHPDSRAIMFEMHKYDKRKIKDLLQTLRGFETTLALVAAYEECRKNGESTPLIDRLICVNYDLPDITQDLQHFKNAFDHALAQKDGIIIPRPGVDKDYEAAVERVKDCERNVEDYKNKIGRELKCKITYVGTGRNRLQLEIPDSVSIGKMYDLTGQRKGFKRVQTADLRILINTLSVAESERDKLRADTTRKIFEDFDSRKEKWSCIVQRFSQLDVLLCLARYANTSGLEMSRPEFVFDSDKPVLSIISGVHPCLGAKKSSNIAGNVPASSSFIANDTELGNGSPLTVLLTGPNMGGKSTLMRQVAVLTVLAHMGSLVPARSMRLSPVDRIFTRIGANDRIMAGQSTFFVELNETRIIMRDATKDSLVVIDELGRGTSTFDGTAIASAVLCDVADRLVCRSFFSTHYHTLCERVQKNERVRLAHMACMVENENEDDPTMESVTFLYRLTDGICPKSYGFYAAKLAGISDQVVRNAYAASARVGGCGRLASLKEAARKGDDLDKLVLMVQSL